MRIEKVSLTNFRQYRSLSLDLSDDRSDMVLLIGKNGAGKTNLLNAMIWCLYGREEYYSKQMDNAPLVNQGALLAAGDGDLIPCEVTLELRFANGVEARITRRADFAKTGNDARPVGKPDLSVAYLADISKGMEVSGNPEHWIERWIPSRLEPYFLFDGERLDDFFKDAEAKKIEDAVLQIAQIDLLGRLVDHLDKVSSSLYSKAANQSGGAEMGVLRQQLDAARDGLQRGEGDLKEKEAALLEHESVVRRLESKFGDIQKVHAEIQRRKQKEADLEHASGELRDAWKALHKWAVQVAPAVLASDALHGLAAEVDSARAERRLPPPVDPDMLSQWLNDTECVCGNSLKEGTPGRQAIERLLAEYAEVGRVGEEMLAVESETRNLLGLLRSSDSAANALMKRIGDWEARQQRLAEELEVLNARLAKHDDENVARIQAELEKAKQTRAFEQREVAKLELQCDELRGRIRETEREMERVATKDATAQKLMLEARFAKECLRAATKLYSDLTDEVRDRVSSTLEKQFLAMTLKREGLKTVAVDPSYKVIVRNRDGFDLLNVLSAGERECLALAFSLALSEVSGYELPMVIDTPMGRLSGPVQEDMSRVLVETTRRIEGEPAHQLIMLMTDTEYNDRVNKVLAGGNPRVFEMEWNQDELTTQVKEVS